MILDKPMDDVRRNVRASNSKIHWKLLARQARAAGLHKISLLERSDLHQKNLF